jgi:hypothetical protein
MAEGGYGGGWLWRRVVTRRVVMAEGGYGGGWLGGGWLGGGWLRVRRRRVGCKRRSGSFWQKMERPRPNSPSLQ